MCLHLGEQWLLLLAWLMSSGCRYRILGNQFFFVVVLNLVCKSLAIEIYETQYLCHLRSKNKLIKLPPRNLSHALSFDFVEFLWQNYWIFNICCTIGLNISKPSQYIPTHQGLFNGTKSAVGGTVVWDILMWQTKQTRWHDTWTLPKNLG
jgi:hypothetical protein